MSDFVDRMITEYTELETKTTKLNEFIHNKKYLELNEENRALLNAMLMAESDTIIQYQYAKQTLIKLFNNEPAKAQVLAKLVDNVIEDEEDHIESFNKAAAIIVGNKEPKATEYNEAVKGE